MPTREECLIDLAEFLVAKAIEYATEPPVDSAA